MKKNETNVATATRDLRNAEISTTTRDYLGLIGTLENLANDFYDFCKRDFSESVAEDMTADFLAAYEEMKNQLLHTFAAKVGQSVQFVNTNEI